MSYADYVANLPVKVSAVQRLDEYISSLPEVERDALLWILKNKGSREAVRLIKEHDYPTSLDTVTAWKQAHRNVV